MTHKPSTTTSIVVKLQVAGTHSWPRVVDFPELKAVHYLQHDHRHVFHIRVEKEVTHDDRDIEIIMLKQEIEKFFRDEYYTERDGLCVFGSKSCEMMCEMLLWRFDLDRVECLEDGENGAKCVRNPTHA